MNTTIGQYAGETRSQWRRCIVQSFANGHYTVFVVAATVPGIHGLASTRSYVVVGTEFYFFASDHDWDILEYRELACRHCQHRQRLVDEDDAETARKLRESCQIEDCGSSTPLLPSSSSGSSALVQAQFISCGTRRDGSAILIFPDDPSVNIAPDGPGMESDMGLSPAALQLAERRRRMGGGKREDSPQREIVWDEIQARLCTASRCGRRRHSLPASRRARSSSSNAAFQPAAGSSSGQRCCPRQLSCCRRFVAAAATTRGTVIAGGEGMRDSRVASCPRRRPPRP